MLPYHRKLLSAVGGGGFNVQAVAFNGSSDYYNRADYVGNADGKEGTVSFWIKFNAAKDGQQQDIIDNSGSRFIIIKQSNNRMNVTIQGASAPINMTLISNGTVTSSDGWVHFMASWDLANTTAHMYIDGVDDLSTPSLNDIVLDYTSTSQYFMADGGIQHVHADIAEFYFSLDYIDLSSASNRAKFRSASGKPVNLGVNGSVPTGSQPLIYLSNRPGDSASDFATNRGTGGNFSVNGSPVIASTSPSD